jgi:hypothetical protein|tara:strand:+ start:638 stop:1030 length:393 start_codon:yes stop_codon:yes gene_type:complete
MNTFKILASAVLLVGALGTTSVAAEPLVAAERTAVSSMVQSRDGLNRRVRIHNNTGWTMLRFYASDSRVTSWQEDMLGRGTLATGRSVMMNIDDGSGACLYDFKAEFTNGQTLTRFNVNVCEIADYNYTR